MMGLYALFLASCGKEQTSASLNPVTPLACESYFQQATTLAGCPNPPSVTFLVTDVPGYSGCTFPVTVQYCDEYDPSTNSHHTIVGNYTMGNHNCQLFMDSLDLISQTPTAIDDNAFVSRFDNLMYQKLEDYLFDHLGHIVGCSGYRNWTISFIKQACSAICFYDFRIDQDPKDDGDGSRSLKVTHFVRTSCSTEGCCRRQAKICKNSAGNLEKVVEATTYPNNITPQNACSGGSMLPPAIPEGGKLIRCTACGYSCK